MTRARVECAIRRVRSIIGKKARGMTDGGVGSGALLGLNQGAATSEMNRVPSPGSGEMLIFFSVGLRG